MAQPKPGPSARLTRHGELQLRPAGGSPAASQVRRSYPLAGKGRSSPDGRQRLLSIYCVQVWWAGVAQLLHNPMQTPLSPISWRTHWVSDGQVLTCLNLPAKGRPAPVDTCSVRRRPPRNPISRSQSPAPPLSRHQGWPSLSSATLRTTGHPPASGPLLVSPVRAGCREAPFPEQEEERFQLDSLMPDHRRPGKPSADLRLRRIKGPENITNPI